MSASPKIFYMAPKFFANIYAIMSIIISLLLFFSYPPFQSPHESQHFLHGLTFSGIYQDATLPTSIVKFVKVAKKQYANRDHGSNTPVVTIELDEDRRRTYTSTRNVAVYSFVNYVPQMISGTIGYIFKLAPQSIYTITRIIGLVLGIVFGYIILRMLPAYHVPALVMLLLPSVWVMRIQQYPGQVVNIAALFFFMLVLRVLSKNAKITPKQTMALVTTGMILSASKVVYFPITLSILLIGASYFYSIKHRVVVVGCVLAFSAFASVGAGIHALQVDYGINISNTLGTTAESDLEKHSAPQLQQHPRHQRWQRKQGAIHSILDDPLRVAAKVYANYVDSSFWKNTLPEIVMWHKNRLASMLMPVSPYIFHIVLLPFLLSLVSTLLLGGGSSKQCSESYLPDVKGRLLLLAVIALTALSVSLALYTGDGQGVHGRSIQGRYLIPLLPFVACLCGFRVVGRWLNYYVLLQVTISLIIIAIMYLGIVGMA